MRDSGLLHALFLIKSHFQLPAHPSFGFSWEGFCIEQIIGLARVRDEECFTWSIQSGPEVDLIVQKPAGLFGFECKAGDAPRSTSSMNTAVRDLGLTTLFVIYPRELNYPMGDRIEAIAFKNLQSTLNRIIPREFKL